MSLNGLEAAEVIEAHHLALEEGGGWFLLKYISRDEVDLLDRGSEGLVEVQDAVNRYEEQSPLFGLIQYRRRKVLLKYVPEGTSRLLQARVTVHFRSVTEKLAPHDAIFSFTKATDLQDSALSSAVSLHTATAPSKSSCESIPPRSLAEIAEDASESRVSGAKDQKSVEKPQRNSLPRQGSGESQTRSDKGIEDTNANHLRDNSPSATTHPILGRARTISNVDKALPPIPGEIISNHYTNERVSTDKPEAGSVLDHGSYEARQSVEGRTSSHSVRPSSRDLYDANGYRQKVKLGPRPSTDSAGRADNLDRINDFRPVSTLPTGLRMPTRKATVQKMVPLRPQSQQRQRDFSDVLSQREKTPAGPITPIHIPDRKAPIVSHGLLTPAKTPGEANSPKMTPEKRRLMKALQLRQKQLAIQQSKNGPGSGNDSTEVEPVKSEIDTSSLSAVPITSSLEVDPDPVPVAVIDLSKEASRNVEASPISVPETSDGPSTQASSVTDEEEIATQNKQEPDTRDFSRPLPSECLPSDIMEGSTDRELSTRIETQSQQISHEADSPGNYRIPDDHNAEVESGEPMQPPFETGTELKTKETDVQEITIPLPLLDSSPFVTSDLLLAPKREASTDNFEKHVGVEVNSSFPAQLPEQVCSQRMVEDDGSPIKEAYTQTSQLEQERPEELDLPTQDPNVLAEVADTNDPTSSQLLPKSSSRSSEVVLDRDIGSSHVAPTQNYDRNVVEPSKEEMTSYNKVHSRESPLEVPLPPIDEDEEACLGPRGALSEAPPALKNLVPQTESGPRLSQDKRCSQDSELTATRSSTSDTINEPQSERQIRRCGVVNPLNRISSLEHSDEHFLSDDSFMEELKSATLQEAKPISVSKSPIKPVFSRSDSEQRLGDATKALRSVSSPLDQASKEEEVFRSTQSPAAVPSRSFSANHSLWPESQQTPAPMPKKIGVSSGISQRIKALEQLSSRPSSPQSPAPSGMTTFVTQRKSSFRSPPRTSDHKTDLDSKSRSNSAYPSPSPSPEAVKPNPFNNLNYAAYSRPESISVTATIVRDSKNKTPEMPVNPSEPRKMDLHQSPLVVEHQKMAPPPLSPLRPPRPPYARYSSARSGSSSSTEQKVETPQTARRDSFASILSRSSRAGSEAELPRSLSDSSLSGMTNRDDNKEEKKDSRRSRLLRRMSSISSVSRRSIANALSPGPKEAPIIERQEPIAEATPTQVHMGDVNIQFPDTLLWKRRYMIIDEQGMLILSAPKSDNNSKIIPKKFPLSEFRPPYIPDLDRQELPHSVILDFNDGSTLQCACEHSQGQMMLLQALREAYSQHQS